MPRGQKVIPVTTSVPGEDVTPVGAVLIQATGINAIEISGRVSAGTGKLIVLRRVYHDTAGPHFRFRPFAPDKAIDPVSEPLADGWFCDRFIIGETGAEEAFALWNPGGSLTLDNTVAVLIRELRL